MTVDKYLTEAARKLAAIESTGSFHEDTILALMALFRQHIEANNLMAEFRITHFYCNWSLHDQLDRGIVQDILQELSEIVSDLHGTDYNDRVNETLGLTNFRSEVRNMLDTAGIQSSLFNIYRGWIAFSQVLVKSLVGKPLVRKNRVYTTPRVVNTLSLKVSEISKLHPDYVERAGIRENTVFWEAFVLPERVTITGPLVVTASSEVIKASSVLE